MTVFNRHVKGVTGQIEEPDQKVIENTLNLRQVSLENAARYGGPITREALGAMEIRGDRKYVIVDTKVNFLMPGMYPAIPGWHTDGVPRGDSLDPGGKGEPKLSAQEAGSVSSSHYHLLVTGHHSQTEFLNDQVDLDLPDSRDLYAQMTEQVTDYLEKRPSHQWLPSTPDAILVAPSCRVVEWDWWDIHRAVPATATAWRYLIRVTETDHIKPRENPDDFIRVQTQVYLPVKFGW